MNARDGMRRLRAERREYGLCIVCGARLESGYALRTCPEFREIINARQRKQRRIKRENRDHESEGRLAGGC